MSEYKETNDQRFGRLMQTNCIDSNIEVEELANACRRLGISGPLEPLLRELNTKETTSYQSEVKESPRKSSQKKERRERQSSRTREPVVDSLDESYDHLVGQKSNKTPYGQESWGRDSGARDLSPEPNRILENLIAETQLLDNDSSGGTSAMIQLASKLQVAALSALKTEVLELSTRLQNSERERDSIQKKLSDALEEKERSQRRLEAIASAHESRITEMHCVIVELSKKLKNQQESAIIEEHEPEGSVSELSFQEGSVYNSEMEQCTNGDQQSITEPLDVRLVQCEQKSDKQELNLAPDQLSETHYSVMNTVGGQVQLQAMQEEILYLRSHIALLQSKLASVEDTIDTRAMAAKDVNGAHRTSSKQAKSFGSDEMCETSEMFDASMMDDTNHDSLMWSSRLVQKSRAPNASMSQSMQNNHTMTGSGEAKCTANIRGNNSQDDGNASGTIDEIPETQMRSEIERLHRSIDHLRAQNNVLQLSLADSKALCERLYLLSGKYESNAIALNQALNCSDRTIEAYDVMLALLESKLGIMEDTDSAIESRRAAETVAKHLMARLGSDTNIQGNSLGPWQDAASLYTSGNVSNTSTPWTDEDDGKLRAQMSKLKGQRATIQNTVVNIESPFSAEDEEMFGGAKKSSAEARKGDLEAAVLMQELMSMREEICEHKSRAEQAERERTDAHERLTVMQQALLHLQAQLTDSEALLAMNNRDRTSFSEAEHSAGIEMELVEALARESRLKARLQSLAGSLEAATKSSEEKYAQVQTTVAELKQTNLSLTQSLERCKRKYQNRIKRMEQQLLEMSIKQQQSPNQSKLVPETTL